MRMLKSGMPTNLPRPYNELSSRASLGSQQNCKLAALIPAELPFSEQTSELINTFRVLRSLQQEFGPRSVPNLHQHEPRTQRSAEVLLLARKQDYDPAQLLALSKSCRYLKPWKICNVLLGDAKAVFFPLSRFPWLPHL